MNLKGDVKSVCCTRHDADTMKQQLSKEIDYFNKDGNIVEAVYYHQSGKIYEKMSCKFTPEGKLIESSLLDDSSRVKLKKVYQYDETGILSKCFNYEMNEMGRSTIRTIIAYDRAGNEITRTVYENDVLTSKTTNEFVTDKETSDFESDYPVSGKIKERFIYTFDSHHNVIEMISLLFATGDTSVVSKIVNKNEYKYDTRGNITESFHTQSGGIPITPYTITKIYEYDSRGNWIRDTTYTTKNRTRSLTSFEERDIVYY